MVDTSNYQHWIKNGLPIFISIGIFSIKGLWDSWLLEGRSAESLQAFALVFPIIILANVIALALTNAVMGTASMWMNKGYINTRILPFFLLAALILGAIMSLLLILLLDPLIHWFNAEKYRIELHAFTVSLILWLPFQCAMVLLGQILRVVGRYKSSSLIQILACVVGFGISYWLINVKTELEPLKSVVYSNAAIAILAFGSLSVLLFTHINKSKTHSASLDIVATYKYFLEVFYTTCLSQSMAVVFIFVLTKLLAQQGGKSIEIYAYLTRIEQLILMLSAAFISVMISEINKMKVNSAPSLIDDYIHQGAKFLLGIGVILVGILLGALTLFDFFSTSDKKLDQTLLMFVSLWIFGTVTQSAVILFSQLLNVLYAPRKAIRLNFIRFVVLGIPMIMLGNHLGGILGLALSLLLLNIVSLYISRKILFAVIKASYITDS